MRKFSSTGKRSTDAFDDAEPIEFTVDDSTWTAKVPTSGALALLYSAQAANRDTADAIAAMIDFLAGLLNDEDRGEYRERLFDPDDDFDFEVVTEIVTGLIEEWSDRPTRSSGGSTPTRKRTGGRSTAKRVSTE